jgi:hypothetical protein
MVTNLAESSKEGHGSNRADDDESKNKIRQNKG